MVVGGETWRTGQRHMKTYRLFTERGIQGRGLRTKENNGRDRRQRSKMPRAPVVGDEKGPEMKKGDQLHDGSGITGEINTIWALTP